MDFPKERISFLKKRILVKKIEDSRFEKKGLKDFSAFENFIKKDKNPLKKDFQKRINPSFCDSCGRRTGAPREAQRRAGGYLLIILLER